MGLFGSIGRAVFGGGSKKSPQQDTSKPFHTHSSKKNDTAVSAGADMGPKGGDSRFEAKLFHLDQTQVLWVKVKLKTFLI